MTETGRKWGGSRGGLKKRLDRGREEEREKRMERAVM